ncbi:oligoribonuclease [Trypanosoma rangeli]|uniref:Oligoribonuclease n=1 Tax=Trypanosoma rangeli TaxID=5698 RepID=A0A422NU85_TRYRA|nr:oligoribonuclease [Trypanosoma rangeli]RNF09026.1 oligoribonuclease [Trypanosoma rangeli]|eukprot:RNF09026.1 oligoribonuclease [Trypanosoma rangeli]
MFTFAAYDWVYMKRRNSLQAILLETRAHFVQVDTNFPTETYYKLWRYYDPHADGYRHPQRPGFPAVPIVYIHGNGGCYEDMRFFGRVIGEVNVKLRYQRTARFQEDVKRTLFELYRREGWDMPADGEEIPKDIQQRAEEMVIQRTPLLNTEVFAVDFLEESNTHDGLLMTKEARFLNNSVYLLLHAFLGHYREVLLHATGSLRRSHEEEVYIPSTVTNAEVEYVDSLCSRDELKTEESNEVCLVAKEQIRRFSSLERIRQEVERVRKEGIWIWTESIGGQLAVFAAVLDPQLYAGVVMAGAPLRYPPMLFDTGCVYYNRVVHGAAVFSYAYNHTSTLDWGKIVGSTDAAQILWNLGKVPAQDVAARVSRVRMITINGGALDDIIPPHSSFLLRSTGRCAASEDHQKMLKLAPVHVRRRDVSTEELRGCGMPLSHRGLVFSLQLLDVAADSLIRASLTSLSSALPSGEPADAYWKDQLFPSIVETLPRTLDAYRADEFMFVASLSESTRESTNEVSYHMTNTSHALNKIENICVQSKAVLNLQEIPVEEDDNPESWEALHIFIGATTYAPEEVRCPQLRLLRVGEKDEVPHTEVISRAATKLHLPIRRNDTVAEPGTVLQTVISFQVLQKQRGTSPEWVRPQFCFSVKREKVFAKQFSFVQHDKVDPLNGMEAPTVSHDNLASVNGNDQLSVEKYGRFVLIRNIDSVSLETNMVVSVNNRVVFPHIMCGSFRSFRITFRGTEGVAPDEPGSQQQYFFGPYETEKHTFHYSWRPFFTVPFNLRNVYVVYVISAEEEPSIHVGDLELSQTPRWGEYEYWVWWLGRWTMRLMAVLSTHSLSGKFAGCYTLLFLSVHGCFGVKHFVGSPRTRWIFPSLRKLHPTLLVLVVTLVLEHLSCTVARTLLTVCLNQDPPLRSDDELTAMMDIKEKLTLVFLYALPPRYEACKYSWIRMQSVAPSDVQLDYMLHMVWALCFVVFMTLCEFIMWCCMWPFSFLLRAFLKIRLRSEVPVWRLVAVWSIPVIMHLTIPWLHISITTTVACLLAYAMLWCFPYNSYDCAGPQYRWLCFMLTMLLQLTSHVEGLVLVVRNYIMSPPVVLTDAERYSTLPEHQLAFVVVQGALAVVYGTFYLSLRHCATMEAEAAVKAKRVRNPTKSGLQLKESPDGEKQLSYFLGDIGRWYPRFGRVLKIISKLVMFFALWMSLVAVRRPLEGTITLYGVCLTALFMALVLVRLW